MFSEMRNCLLTTPLVDLLGVNEPFIRVGAIEYNYHQLLASYSIGRTQAGTGSGCEPCLNTNALLVLVQKSIGILPNNFSIVTQFIIPHLALMHLPLEDEPQNMILQANTGQKSHIPGSRVVILVGQSCRIHEFSIHHAQLMRILIHLENEQTD
jgi:hypothetical protein